MKLATAPVNWNSPDVPEYRAYTPYPQLLEEMVAAGYSATEWSSIMPKEPKVLADDLRVRGLLMLGGFVGLELRNPAFSTLLTNQGLALEIPALTPVLGGSKRRWQLYAQPRSGVIGQPRVKRSGTLGISYQLRSALKERHRPRLERASAVVPFCSSFRAGRFCTYPGFRCASPWAKFFNRFAVSPTGPERSCRPQSRLTNYENENKIPVLCSIKG